MCNYTQQIYVDSDAYQAWQEGMLIQKAFPLLDPKTRELMISGTCDKCWNKMFPKCDDDQY